MIGMTSPDTITLEVRGEIVNQLTGDSLVLEKEHQWDKFDC